MDITLFEQAADEFSAYLSEVTDGGLGDGDLSLPTPCEMWTLGDLYRHMVDENIKLGQAVSTHGSFPAQRSWCFQPDVIYRDSVLYLVDAMAKAAVISDIGPVHGPFGALSLEDTFDLHLASTLIHTWDIAMAIDFDFDRPGERILEITLSSMRRLPSETRGVGKPFAAAVDFPTISAVEEILVLSGRSPAWRPGVVGGGA